MNRLLCIIMVGAAFAGAPAVAQFQTFPELEGRIPAPLAPPPQPPIINGPYQQGPPPGVAM